MLYRMAKQTLHSNRHIRGADSIVLIDRQLQACGVEGKLDILTFASSTLCLECMHSCKHCMSYPCLLQDVCFDPTQLQHKYICAVQQMQQAVEDIFADQQSMF